MKDNIHTYCYACTKESVSREHVPAQSFFPKGYRNNLITVPSCKKHNQDNSIDVEYIRNIITTCCQVNEFGIMQLEQKSFRAITRNERLIKKMFSKVTPVILNGEETGSFEIDRKIFDKTFGLLGLALYYHDFSKRFNLRFNIHPVSLFFSESATTDDKNNYYQLLRALGALKYSKMHCDNSDIFSYFRYSDENKNLVYKTVLYGGFVVYLEYVNTV